MSLQPLSKEPKANKSPVHGTEWTIESNSKKPVSISPRIFSSQTSGLKGIQRPGNGSEDLLVRTLFLGSNAMDKNEEMIRRENICDKITFKDPPKGSIRLPSLVPVKRVVASNPYEQLGNGDLREKKLLRRRLNSEDEKSLISFTKMKKIFGGRDRPERKQSLNEGFQIPRIARNESQSQAIFDLTSVKRKTSVRKKSEDLGMRIRTRKMGEIIELRNKSENSIRQKTPEVKMVDSIRDKNPVRRSHMNASNPEELLVFNEPLRGRKRTCKESEHGMDLEQENTKGSSFNTDKDNKNRQWMNNLFENSEHEINFKADSGKNKQGSRPEFNSQETRKRGKAEKLTELCKREGTNLELFLTTSKRKSSFASLRKESMQQEKSENENALECVILDSQLGSTHRHQVYHGNIGSQISEECQIDLDMEVERINVWTCKGNDGESSELQWQVKVMELLENSKGLMRSRKQSEVLRVSDSKSKVYFLYF
jgi:hypothetical protein